MHRAVAGTAVLALVGLLLAGCSAREPQASEEPQRLGRTVEGIEGVAPNLWLGAGQELHWEAAEALGDFAVAAVVVSGGPCHADIAGVRTNDRGIGLVEHSGDGWNSGSSNEPSVQAAGTGYHGPSIPDKVGSSRELEPGQQLTWWLSDLGPTTTRGAGFSFTLGCTSDAALRVEAARRAVLTSGEDFSSDAYVGGGQVGQVVVNGRLSAAYDGPARLLYQCGLAIGSSCSLRASGPEGEQAVAGDYRVQSLAPGDYEFTLQAVNTAFPILFAAGEFHPVLSMDEALALPM